VPTIKTPAETLGFCHVWIFRVSLECRRRCVASLDYYWSGKGRLVFQHSHWEWETADADAPPVSQEAIAALTAKCLLEQATLTILRQPHSDVHSTKA